jgi:cell wall-associated NlpC family hydrolase
MNSSWLKTTSGTDSYIWILHSLILIVVILLFSGCASTPEIKPIVIRPSSHSSVIDYALSLKGTPYRYGGSSPAEGFDCSGFVQHVYKRQGKSLPRTAYDMAMALSPISEDDLVPGDLVFFNTSGRTYSHVGIYIDEDKFIHAPSKRTGRVVVSSLDNDYWQRHYTGARRP